MKTLSLALLFIALVNVAPARAGQLLLVGKSADLSLLKQGMKSRHVFSDLYSPAEKSVLQKRKENELAETLVIAIPNASIEAARSNLLRIIRRKNLSIRVERDPVVRLNRVSSEPLRTDPLLGDQWALKNTGKTERFFLDNFNSIIIKGVPGEDVHLPLTSKSGAGMVIAILDSGFDTEHEDLKGQFVTKPGECKVLAEYQACLAEQVVKGTPATRCDSFFERDTDGNHFPMDCHGWSTVSAKKNKVSKQFGSPVLREEIDDRSTGHGTKVAGIIAGARNQVGIRGIVPQAKILGVKVLGEPPQNTGSMVATDEDAANLGSAVYRGMVYAIGERVDVINLSLGWSGPADSEVMRKIVKLAQDQGIVVVSAAGNDGTDALVYPCQYDRVVCVGAQGPDGQITEFSNFGSGVDLAAPGFNILSSVQDDVDPEHFTDRQGYDFDTGTSFASPYVAGAVALLRAEGYSPKESIARLLVGARKKPYSSEKINLAGNLDVENALKATPRAFFVPVNKGVYPAIWDRETNQAQLGIELRNIWKTGKNVKAKLTLSERDQMLGQIRIQKSEFTFASWDGDTTKELTTQIQILDPKVTSDATLVLEISSEGISTQKIRIQLLLSILLEKGTHLPGAVNIPIQGQLNAGAELLSVQALDGSPQQDYVAFTRTEKTWQIQIIREVMEAGKPVYRVGNTKEIPVEDVADELKSVPRLTYRLDLNFDGKPEYIFTTFIPKEDESKVGNFRLDYRDENGKDVLPAYTFPNEGIIFQLDRFQWIRSGDRLVPIWYGIGAQPEIEKKAIPYDPWHPNVGLESDLDARIYYHDAAAPDGARSITLPKDSLLNEGVTALMLLNQSTEDRKIGKISVLLSETDAYIAKAFVLEITSPQNQPKIFPVRMPKYRNLRSLESSKTFMLDMNPKANGTAFSGNSGLASQRTSAVVKVDDHYELFDQTVSPAEKSDTIYKMVGSFIEGPSTQPVGMAAFGQANYDLFYRDSMTDRLLSTSLRKYTFLAASLFQRLMYPTIAESDGVRLPSVQIPDGFGAYPGAEIIVPLRKNGQSVDLIRPAALRILNGANECDWLQQTEANEANPSAAVYFCQNRFVRIPYRF